MGNVFFTSDWHFSHANIIKYCKRPFLSINEMDNVLINNWNSKISNDDLVFYLGDFMFTKQYNNLVSLRNKLNGKIILIKGNHDYFTDKQYVSAGFESVHQLVEVNILSYDFTLCHYQMMHWNNSHHGTFHLYGHQHDKKQYPVNHAAYKTLGMSERKMNVCMDSNSYFPFSITDVIENLKNKPTNWWVNE